MIAIYYRKLLCLGSSTLPHGGESTAATAESTEQKPEAGVVTADPELEKRLLECLCDASLTLPVDSRVLTKGLLENVSSCFIPKMIVLVHCVWKIFNMDSLSLRSTRMLTIPLTAYLTFSIQLYDCMEHSSHHTNYYSDWLLDQHLGK